MILSFIAVEQPHYKRFFLLFIIREKYTHHIMNEIIVDNKRNILNNKYWKCAEFSRKKKVSNTQKKINLLFGFLLFMPVVESEDEEEDEEEEEGEEEGEEEEGEDNESDGTPRVKIVKVNFFIRNCYDDTVSRHCLSTTCIYARYLLPVVLVYAVSLE